MKKIKVIHVITKLELGGAQQNTIYTVSNLSNEIFEVKLITGRGGILDKEVKNKLKEKVIFVKNLKREISPLNDILALIKIALILIKEKPHIIHTHSSKAGIIARFSAFLARVKIIIHTYHGFGFHEYQNPIVKNFYILLEKIASLISDAIIFVSRANIETAKKYSIGNQNKYHLIRSGIKLENFPKLKDISFAKKYFPNLNDKSKIIVTVANLKPQKNPSDFFKIANEVIKTNKNVFFIYVGGGEKEKELFYKEMIKNLSIESNCVITGWLKNVEDVYKSADIFLLTSLWEGLPRSLVEAMASLVVPVCYETDGIKDLIEDGINGFIVKQNDWSKAAMIIKKLISDDKTYFDIKRNLQKTDLSEFDIDLMVKQQEKLYLDLIKYKI